MGFTLAGLLRDWSGRLPDRPMLTEGDRTVTWAEEDRRSSQVAQALMAEGVGAQERIAFLDKNGLAFFDALFGAAKINAVMVAVNWRLAPPEMAAVIDDSDAKVLFVGRDYADDVASFEDQLTSVKRIVSLDPSSYEEWLSGHSTEDPGVVAAPDDVALQLYTSGTTGLPKGAMLTNSNFESIMPEFEHVVGMDSESVNMVAMPLFHIGGGGWAIAGITYGARSVIIREVDPVGIMRAVEQQGVTHAFLVPAVIMMMLAAPEAATTDFSSFRYMTYGASPISERILLQALSTFGCSFVQFYGMTETSGAITYLPAEDHDPQGPHPERLRSCGIPFRSVELRVVDPDGRDLPVGEPGELWTRSGQNMKGYWRNPEATAATITADGWLKTGDVAYLDGDGYCYMYDRAKDMIVSGGENIYPAEVENALMSHPAVADCAVIGVPSDKWGETVKAIVVVAPGASPAPSAEELIEFTRTRIARYKVPRSVDFIDALPRNASGKILKRELREPYWKGVDRRVN